MDYQFPVWLDVYEVDEYHSFVTGGFGASMVDTVEPIVNVDEHTMPGSGHDAALLCVLCSTGLLAAFVNGPKGFWEVA